MRSALQEKKAVQTASLESFAAAVSKTLDRIPANWQIRRALLQNQERAAALCLAEYREEQKRLEMGN